MAPHGCSAADTTLMKALARAFRWRRMIEAGRYATSWRPPRKSTHPMRRACCGWRCRRRTSLRRSWLGGSPKGWRCRGWRSRFL